MYYYCYYYYGGRTEGLLGLLNVLAPCNVLSVVPFPYLVLVYNFVK